MTNQKENDVTNKISKISKSTAVAAMAAILTFGVASVHEAAAAQRVQHRQPHTVQAPAVRPNGNGAYASSGRHPGWSCVSSDTAGEVWSAYPAWEVGCK